MAGYTVSSALWNGGFFVPADIVDRHLKLAPPDAIRALLYILRNGCSSPDPSEISSALGIDLPAAVDAVEYWVRDGLLCSADGLPVKKAGSADDILRPDVCETPVEDSNPPVVIKSGKMPSYSNAKIREAVMSHPELKYMFSAAEEIFAKPLSDAVINLLFGLYDWFELPTDVIVTILRRCAKGNRLRPAAIKDEAQRFYTHGAVTKEAADKFSAELDCEQEFTDEMVLLFRITDHTPYAKEKKAFSTWRSVYGYDKDVVAVAYEITLKNTESAVYSPELLSYISRVLLNWHKGGIKTAAEARLAAEQKDSGGTVKSRSEENATSKESTSYDLNEEADLAMKRFAKGGAAK